MVISTPYRKSMRSVLAWICLIAVLVVLIYELGGLGLEPKFNLYDFVGYWSPGRLAVTGHNPYAPEQIIALQKEIGKEKPGLQGFWYPPWTLTFLMPFGLLNYSAAATLWLTMHLALVFFSADWIWRFYGGPKSHRWIAWIIPLLYYPTIYVLSIGQISILILFGIIGFLYFIKNRKGWLAGICIFLATIKPNLLYLFWMAFIFWVVDRRFWSALLGLGSAVLVALAVSLCVNSAVITHYASADFPMFYWLTPTPGTLFRLLLGPDKTWLQFISPILGAIWLLVYWTRHRRTWEWGEQMPMLLLMSLVTSFYSWGYDQVVLLVAVIQVAVLIFNRRKDRVTLWAIGSYLGIDILCLILPMNNAFWYIWLAPSILFWYWAVRKKLSCEGTVRM